MLALPNAFKYCRHAEWGGLPFGPARLQGVCLRKFEVGS